MMGIEVGPRPWRGSVCPGTEPPDRHDATPGTPASGLESRAVGTPLAATAREWRARADRILRRRSLVRADPGGRLGRVARVEDGARPASLDRIPVRTARRVGRLPARQGV